MNLNYLSCNFPAAIGRQSVKEAGCSVFEIEYYKNQ